MDMHMHMHMHMHMDMDRDMDMDMDMVCLTVYATTPSQVFGGQSGSAVAVSSVVSPCRSLPLPAARPASLLEYLPP